MGRNPNFRKARASQALVSTSISPFEIIPRGTTIVIESTAVIHEQAIRSGIRIDGVGEAPAISRGGRRFTFTVNKSFDSGQHTLYVTDLFTPDRRRFPANVETPFFVVDSQLPFPRGVKVQSYSRVVFLDDRIRRAAPGERVSYELMKGIRRATGKRWEAAYDTTGQKVDFSRLLSTMRQAHIDRYGRLDPLLHKRLAETGTKPIRVAMWLLGERPVLAKSTRQVTRAVPAAEAAERKRLIAMTRRFVAKHGLRSDVRIDRGAPVLFAELDRETIKGLANAPELGMMFLDEGRMVNDLDRSIRIAQSERAHDLGYTGRGVKVAVCEEEPDVTDELVIEDRYRSDPAQGEPDDHRHSTIVHAIVKNREGGQKPRGHAPECLLYSANERVWDAIAWAAEIGCTVINQSNHHPSETINPHLSILDHYKDWLATHWPYPTICEASGSSNDDWFVVHKGFNRLTVGNHNPSATRVSDGSVSKNPHSDHGDRELPELTAAGHAIHAVRRTGSGTSFAAPAVAGVVACVQQVNPLLKSWPEGCRAILLAAATLNPDGGTWWSDIVAGRDARDGSGALNGLQAVRIAEQRKTRNNPSSPRGFDLNVLQASDLDFAGESTFVYNIRVPRRAAALFHTTVKVALAWNAEIRWVRGHHNTRVVFGSVLGSDLDLTIYDSAGNVAGHSGSWDNSYEIAEFHARHGETYTIKIRRFSGTGTVHYGIAWNTVSTSPRFDAADIADVRLPPG